MKSGTAHGWSLPTVKMIATATNMPGQRRDLAGTVEGFNNKVKLTTRKAYGFRTYEAIEITLYHALGALPEEFTHEFC